MAFRVGQKVVCVDVSPFTGRPPTELTLNAIYTIASIKRYRHVGFGVTLAEVFAEDEFPYLRAFHPARFRPVVERKTDISIFTKLLTPKRVTEPA